MKPKHVIYLLFALILLLLVIIYALVQQCKSACLNECKLSSQTFTPLTDMMRQQLMVPSVQQRDRKVLEDPLYPPLNRPNHPTAEANLQMLGDRAIGVSTRGDADTFRLLGYYVNTHDKTDVWKLFGRQLHARGSQGQFYVMPSDRNQDVKIPIDSTSDTVSPRLRDFYALPTEVRFNHPMFSAESVYQFVELGQDSSLLYF